MMNFNIYQYEPHWYHLGFCYSYHPSTSFVGTELFVVSILILLQVYQSNCWFTSHFRHLWVNGFSNGKVCFFEDTITWNWNVKSGMAQTTGIAKVKRALQRSKICIPMETVDWLLYCACIVSFCRKGRNECCLNNFLDNFANKCTDISQIYLIIFHINLSKIERCKIITDYHSMFL